MISLAIFYPEGHSQHFQDGHPERPERVETIRQVLQTAGIWEVSHQLSPAPLPDEVLHAIHHPTYLGRLRRACARGQWLDPDTYTTPASWELALQAAGGAVAIARAVWRREATRGFALTRPPGHHATSTRGMGFCLLNNVALATEYLRQSEGAQRLAILDFDLHHGNGTQDIFYRRGDVCYLSIHQYPHYPGTGRLEETGAEAGSMTTANLPLPPLSGDRAMRVALDWWVLPLLDRWAPEMLLISLGFDAHWRDPFGQLLFSVSAYAKAINALVYWADNHCQGRLAIFLEGGYDLEAIGACSLAVARALLNQTIHDDPLGPSPFPEGKEWQAMLHRACRFWGLNVPPR